MSEPRRLRDLPLPQQAGILCSDMAFGKFVAARVGTTFPFNATACAEWLRRQCRIESRRALATDKAAAARFEEIRTEFDAWRGRIAAPDQHREKA